MANAEALRRRIEDGRPVVGTTVQFPSTDIVEIIGRAGYDFVMLDAEHGALDIPILANLIVAADARNLAAMVRVPDASPAFISRVMDAGAAGVVVPNVRSRLQAETAVRACKFAPAGQRGACATTRAAGFLAQDWGQYVREANAQSMVWLLLEDMAGVDNAADILAVAGVDAVALGAFDLAQSLGLEGRTGHERVQACFARLHDASRRNRVQMISVTASEPDGVEGAKRRGAAIYLDGFDAQMISAAFRGQLKRIREALAP